LLLEPPVKMTPPYPGMRGVHAEPPISPS
jgi:hypothetical protein